MSPDHRFLEDLEETSNRIDPVLTIDHADDCLWDDACDVMVVGVGLAGACAALRTAEDRDLQVMAIDRGLGGGASQLSGGIVYMGGGTPAQKAAGVADTPENMAEYLKFETGDIVRPDTVERYARASTGFQAWLEKYGARFGGPATDAKTSYPEGAASLYYSGNEITATGRKLATPAQRGHRAQPSKGGDPTGQSGVYLLPPLLASIDRQPNIRFWRQTRAKRLIVDRQGEIVGIEVLRIPPGFAAKRHAFLYGLSNNTPLAIMNLLDAVRRAAIKIERNAARPMRIRVRKGVVLSAGGFAYNRVMVAKAAPAYLEAVALGTIADDGSGIKLGMTVGGKTDRLDRLSAWKFLYPPLSYTKACSIGPDGERLLSEELYGARTGAAIFEQAGGKGWLILDEPLQKAAIAETKTMKKLLFQAVMMNATLKKYTVSADTLEQLAARIGVPADRLVATIRTYNDAIEAGVPDPLTKSETLRRKIGTAPFYATDIGAGLKLSPIPALTMGGLVVDEDTGQVIDDDGMAIKGLYAAGRNAVGICSEFYISGLSLGDCVWSGLRAAESLKGNGGAKALAP